MPKFSVLPISLKVCVLLVTCAPAYGGSACGPLPQRGVDLANAAKLFLRVQGNQDLTGEYRVDADNTVSFPVIGRLSVAGLSLACLEEKITKAASDVAQRDVFLTLEVVAYKPVFVMGVVKSPGSQEWFPGMTPLHAMASAGGVFRQELISLPSDSRFSQQQIYLKRLGLLVRIARLKAEINGVDDLDLNNDLSKSDPVFLTMINAEQLALRNRLAAVENDSLSIKQSMKVAGEELDAVSAEQRLLQDQLSKGTLLTRDERAELERKQLENSVARARVSATLATLERELRSLEVGRRANLSIELVDAEQELAQADIELKGLQSMTGSVSPATSKTVYTVVREVMSERAHRQTIGESDPLEPGDVLIIDQVVSQ